MAAAPPAQPSVDSPESATREVYYRLSGTGLRTATVREPATFSIEACDDKGARVEAAGDGSFFVSVRGVAPVRARIMDHADGRYTVSWQPPQSGKYSFNVSHFGVPLDGCPFTVGWHGSARWKLGRCRRWAGRTARTSTG